MGRAKSSLSRKSGVAKVHKKVQTPAILREVQTRYRPFALHYCDDRINLRCRLSPGGVTVEHRSESIITFCELSRLVVLDHKTKFR